MLGVRRRGFEVSRSPATAALGLAGRAVTAVGTSGSASDFTPQPGFTGSLVGSTLTIGRGAGGFGTKANAATPLLYMPLATSVAPSALGRVTSSRTLEGLTFSATGGADGNGCLTGTGVNGAGDNVWTVRLESDDWAGYTYDWNSYDQKIFISRLVKKNFGDLSGTTAAYNVKDVRFWGRSAGGLIQAPSTYFSPSLGRFGTENLPNSPYFDYVMNETVRANAGSIQNRWYREEIVIKVNSAATNTGPTTDQEYKWSVDGGNYILKSPYTTYDTFYLRWKNASGDVNDGRLRTMFPVHKVVDSGTGSRPVAPVGSVYQVDDLYVDDSWCRVVAGDSSTYASCTDRWPLPVIAWSDTSVTVNTASTPYKNVFVVPNTDVSLYAGDLP